MSTQQDKTIRMETINTKGVKGNVVSNTRPQIELVG